MRYYCELYLKWFSFMIGEGIIEYLLHDEELPYFISARSNDSYTVYFIDVYHIKGKIWPVC